MVKPRIWQFVRASEAAYSTVRAAAIVVFLACVLVGAQRVNAQVNVNVTTYHNDNARTGENLNETVLNPGNVNADAFGKLFTCDVDGQVYAQPLVMSNIGPMPDGNMHNVVFAATQHDGVYAFDADGGPGRDTCIQLWQRSFIDPDNGITPVPQPHLGQPPDITPELGITSTPVINADTGRLFVIAKTEEIRDSTGECQDPTCRHFVQTLYALDVTTGQDTLPPRVIGDTVNPTGASGNNAYGYIVGTCVPGIGNGHIVDPDGNNIVCFNAMREHERTGIVLANGVLYLSWASHTDTGPYHGWVIGYDPATLQQIDGAVFNTTPNGGLGGTWMGGGAIAVDPNDGSLYFSTGNGTFAINDTDSCTHHGPPDDIGPCNPAYGDTVLKLSPSGGLSFVDFFTPFNQLSLDNSDADLASGGVLLVPDVLPGAHANLLITAGKEGKIYSVDRDDLGAYTRCGPVCDDVVAFTPSGTVAGQAADTPAYLNTGLGERRVYYVGAGDHLKIFTLGDDGKLTKVADGTQNFTGGNSKGATVSISGSVAGDGTVFNAIAWATQAGGTGELAVLRAYDALANGTLTELYDSNQRGLRDQLGCGMKFSVPTVANGSVYVGTGPRSGVSCTMASAGQLTVFGLF